MSTRITIKDVRIQFARTVRAAQSVGLDSSRWALAEGSVTYGRAYRLPVHVDNRIVCADLIPCLLIWILV